MQKNKLKTIVFTSLVMLFVGTASVIAAWPDAPNASTPAGWLGIVFNVEDSTNLDIKKPVKATNIYASSNIEATSQIKATTFLGNTFTYSDASLKTDIKTLNNSLEKVNNLRGVSFDWKEGEKSDIGFIAQEVESIYPELVMTDEETGLKALKYANITAILVEAMKAQQAEIELLKAEIELLKN